MANMIAGIVAVVLCAPCGLRPPETAASGTPTTEEEVRATSARNYSELLRLACTNGWKFRRSDVAAGFHRHFDELRLALIDRGTTIVPLAYAPELELTEIFFGLVELPHNPDRRGCFRGRWQKPVRKDLRVAPEATSATRQLEL